MTIGNDHDRPKGLSLPFTRSRALIARLKAELRSERVESEKLQADLQSERARAEGLADGLRSEQVQVESLKEQLRAAEEALASAREVRQQLQYHRDTLRRTRQRLVGPSFHRDLQLQINYADALREFGIIHPLRSLVEKLRNYDFAASHGVSTPRILTSWATVDEVTLSGLPDEFVLKFDGGASSKGVLPLRRHASERYSSVDGRHEYSESEVRAILMTAWERGQAYGTLFAEELLQQAGRAGVPDDVKIYVAYGNVLQVLLRRVDEHGAQDAVFNKYVDEFGTDLGEVTATRRFDASIPVPETLPDMVKIAKHLSRAVGVPFCRVDLYDTTRGVVLGEITRSPGGAQTYRLDHDQWMGMQWLKGRAELDRDLMAGRPFGTIHGTSGGVDLPPDPGSVMLEWRRTIMDCDVWCETQAPVGP